MRAGTENHEQRCPEPAEPRVADREGRRTSPPAAQLDLGPYQFPGIPPEYTNWRDEVRAWKDGVALLEQSYHMTELHLRGPEVIPFLKDFAVNKLDVFPVGGASSWSLAAPDGNLIADAIIFHEDEDFYRIVGAPFASDWLLFNAERTSHVADRREERQLVRASGAPRRVPHPDPRPAGAAIWSPRPRAAPCPT